LFERFFVLGGFKVNAAKLEYRRDVLAFGLVEKLFDGPLKKSDSRVAIVSERSLDEVFERSDRRHGRISGDLIARERKRRVVLIQNLVSEIALQLLQLNQRSAAIVLLARKPAFADVNHTSRDRNSAVAAFAGDSIGPHHHEVGARSFGDLDHRRARQDRSRRKSFLFVRDIAFVGPDRNQAGLVEQIGEGGGKAFAYPVVFNTPGEIFEGHGHDRVGRRRGSGNRASGQEDEK